MTTDILYLSVVSRKTLKIWQKSRLIILLAIPSMGMNLSIVHFYFSLNLLQLQATVQHQTGLYAGTFTRSYMKKCRYVFGEGDLDIWSMDA